MLKKLLPLFALLPLWTVVAANDAPRSPTILILGDSLSAGYGIPEDSSWVRLLAQRLESSNCHYRVLNASASGDTSRTALGRLDGILERDQPAVAVVELGGNDGLRGIHPDEMQKNLGAIIEKLQAADASVVLVPMKIPPNYGPAFSEKFEAVYPRLAEHHDLMLTRFILAGIAEHPELMQDDGIHPKAHAQEQMLNNVWDVLKAALISAIGDRPGGVSGCELCCL